MSRNKIDANGEIFESLDRYCARGEEPADNAGTRRFIATDDEDQKWLIEAEIAARLRVTSTTMMASLHFRGRDYLALLGVGTPTSDPFAGADAQLEEVATNPGLLTALWAELKPSPTASAGTVRNILDVGDMSNQDYEGHSAAAIGSLFPQIRVFRSADRLTDEETWRLMCAASITSGRDSDTWVEAELANEMLAAVGLNVPGLPFVTFCRSMFDADPRSLFLSLYRCLEAMYAHSQCVALIESLGLETTWQDLASELYTTISWRPREASSLEVVLSHALDDDLARLCDGLGGAARRDSDKLAQTTAKHLYKVRNQLVHARPWSDYLDHEKTDWNSVCTLLLRIVADAHDRVHTADS